MGCIIKECRYFTQRPRRYQEIRRRKVSIRQINRRNMVQHHKGKEEGRNSKIKGSSFGKNIGWRILRKP